MANEMRTAADDTQGSRVAPILMSVEVSLDPLTRRADREGAQLGLPPGSFRPHQCNPSGVAIDPRTGRLWCTGYEVIRLPLHPGGKSEGEYQDFLTGFVLPNGQVWGRPVGVTTARDGALLVTDDGSNSIWRVSYVGE